MTEESSTMASIPLITKPAERGIVWDDGGQERSSSNLQLTASKATRRKKAKSRNRLGTIDSVDEKYLRDGGSPDGHEQP